MLCLGIGDCIEVYRNGKKAKKSIMSLHIQSEWRITSKGKKEILQIWMNERTDLYIKSYKINRYGDLQLTFSNGEQLTTFTDASNDDEMWRFLTVLHKKHLVFTGLGCQFE